MPLHNTVKGSVIETLDCFLSVRSSSQSTNAEAGPSRPRIVGDLSLAIRHCLVAKRGVTMEDIEWVRSHEQVRSTPQYSFIFNLAHGLKSVINLFSRLLDNANPSFRNT